MQGQEMPLALRVAARADQWQAAANLQPVAVLSCRRAQRRGGYFWVLDLPARRARPGRRVADSACAGSPCVRGFILLNGKP